MNVCTYGMHCVLHLIRLVESCRGPGCAGAGGPGSSQPVRPGGRGAEEQRYLTRPRCVRCHCNRDVLRSRSSRLSAGIGSPGVLAGPGSCRLSLLHLCSSAAAMHRCTTDQRPAHAPHAESMQVGALVGICHPTVAPSASLLFACCCTSLLRGRAV